ncbi:MAG: insulinase family protein [Zoogloeaceae bacterium]|nr:insulinase family protein [Zoogloeaceae bacterium]
MLEKIRKISRIVRMGVIFLGAALGAAVFAKDAWQGVNLRHWQSPTGAQVFFVESRALPILDVQLDFRAGSLVEPMDKAGVAELVRALMPMGAGDLDETAIADRLADIGAKLSGGVEEDRANLSLRTLSAPLACAVENSGDCSALRALGALEKREAALEIFRQILAAPRFDAKIFQREQTRLIAQLKDDLTRPQFLASRAFAAALYPRHPYGRSATPESLASITVEDARQFWKRHYAVSGTAGKPNGITLTMVGNLDVEEARQIAEQLLAALPVNRGEAVSLPPAPEAARQGGAQFLDTAADVDKPLEAEIRLPHPATQAHLYLGLPAIARGDPDFFPLLVGNYILGGGGFASRLMEEVRERRGLAYSVYSAFSPRLQSGPFFIALETKKEQADEALALVREVLRLFLEKGVSAKELDAAKSYLVGSFPLNLSSNRDILRQVSTIGFYGLPLEYLRQYQANIQAVTQEEIRAAFARHVPWDRLISVMVGAPGQREESALPDKARGE